ncbi:DNA polymerase III subunit delta' C-terminal domain-containing protein [Enterobacteriaceae endosymbiont of Plateumaris braccata]|uniref:DNA polymerase III subunit delta' C-terminal domain-containing protein n=1 Tax=Enterobacteriaceae endosymbiont of Plateumaris braccata TaxID=2675793 RepID=UPI001449E462|nr:DNA polymerase III subunit delta' C-terminal domain-containing protein [Enterobacteriaceae endosymbiont of Plateumaris braccata]QJC28052.1 hypothetical protein GJT80_00470 [Enterobacteriaceae endosymbiont of Plateumaris braccata]
MSKYKTLSLCYPWLNNHYKTIIQQFLRNKSYHAFIFCSINGIGTIDLVYALIKWILCTNKKFLNNCKKCTSCILIKTGNHPDLYIVKKNNTNISISIDNIRNIINNISNNSYINQGKIIWLPYAKQLNHSSSNAILKILEEPPKNTWFFMQCYQKNDLLPTISSRCQIWYINTPSENDGLFWIQKQSNNFYEKKIIITALRVCNHSPINAYKLLNSFLWIERKNLYEIFISAIKYDILYLLKILNNKNILLYLHWLYFILIDVIKYHLKINKKFFYNLDQYDSISVISSIIKLNNIFLIIDDLLYYRNCLININYINQKLVLIRFLLSFEKKINF